MRVFEKNSNIFKLLSEAVSEGVVVVNQEQLIVAANKQVNSMFGYEKDELLGNLALTLIPETFHTKLNRHIQPYFKNPDSGKMVKNLNITGKRNNNVEFPVEVSLTPFSIYGNGYLLVLINDMTYLREKEHEIHELNTRLEQKIKVRTVELRDTVAELKKEIKRRIQAETQIKNALHKERELNELKTKFLSLVSHEFKTPLSGILTSAILIGKYTKTEHQDKRNKHLKTILGEVRHLNNILNDFLSIERLEKGKEVYNLTDFPLSNVINEVVYNTNMLLKSGQHITYPQNIDDVVIHQDKKIVALTLSNLLHNATKYSLEDSKIDLQVDILKGKVVFRIKDEGIGIPEKDQKHIFERYFRAENVLLNHGTGIGLNIVKGHLENLGGSIYFKSEENKGSIFTVEFPTKKLTSP